jgi:hypothetical protein
MHDISVGSDSASILRFSLLPSVCYPRQTITHAVLQLSVIPGGGRRKPSEHVPACVRQRVTRGGEWVSA